MATDQYITSQKLQGVTKALGVELTLAFDLLTAHLGHVYDAGMSLGHAARARAELREARRIVLQIKHSDPETLIRKEEMAWALSKITAACDTISLHPVTAVMHKIEDLLGINADSHEIPRDLDKKIGNAVRVLLHSSVSADTVAAAS